MTNKEAIRSLQNIVEYWGVRPTEQETARLAIVALEQQDKERWIPLSERLPEVTCDIEDEDCPYFNATLEDGLVCTLQFTGDGEDWFDEFGTVYNNVIAWRYLPDRYKADEI